MLKLATSFSSLPALQGDLDPGAAQEHLRLGRRGQVRHHGQGSHLGYGGSAISNQGLQPQHHPAPRAHRQDGRRQEAQQLLQRHRGTMRVSGEAFDVIMWFIVYNT